MRLEEDRVGDDYGLMASIRVRDHHRLVAFINVEGRRMKDDILRLASPILRQEERIRDNQRRLAPSIRLEGRRVEEWDRLVSSSRLAEGRVKVDHWLADSICLDGGRVTTIID